MGEDGKLSKKQLAKLAKKDKKATAKAGEGGDEGDSKPSGGAQQAAPVQSNTSAGHSNISSYFGGPLADHWELLLEDQQWLSGSNDPSQADAEALRHLGGRHPNPALYPNLFGWWSMCERFKPERQQSWAAGTCPIPAGYVPPKP